MLIKYDQPIEVSQVQYNLIMKTFRGSVAGCTINNKFYIKVWIMCILPKLETILNLNHETNV